MKTLLISLFILFSFAANAQKAPNHKRRVLKKNHIQLQKQDQTDAMEFGDSVPANQTEKVKKLVGFEDGEKSIELIFGKPVGVRYQHYLGWKSAYNIDVGYQTNSIIAETNYVLYGYDAKDKWRSKNFWNSTYFYYGPGVLFGKQIKDGSDFLFAFRGFAGIEYLFVNSSYAVRTEVAGLAFTSGPESFGVQLFIGLAYHWDRKKTSLFKNAD